MKTTLRTDITLKDISDGFVYNELERKGFNISVNGKQIYKRLFIKNRKL